MVPTWVLKGDRSEMPADTPAAFAKLIEDCWLQDRAARPSASQVRERVLALSL